MLKATIAALVLLGAMAATADPVEEENKRIVSLIYNEIFGKWRIAENEHIYSSNTSAMRATRISPAPRTGRRPKGGRRFRRKGP